MRKISISKIATKIGSGSTPRGGKSSYLEEGVPFIRSQNVRFGRLKMDNIAFIGEDVHQKMKRTQVRPGDVLLNITGASIGRSAVVTDDVPVANVNQHVCIIRVDANNYIPQFLSEFLNSRKGQYMIDVAQSGGSRQGLNFQEVGALKIPNVELSIQEKIVEILSDCDVVIALLDKKLSCLRLSMSVRIEDLIWQENYPRAELLANCTLVNEKVLPASMPAQVKCIELEHIDADAAGTINGFSNSEGLSSQKTKFAKGDVLFGKLRPYLRKFAYAEFDGICSTEIWALRGHSERMLSRFLFYVLRSKRIYAEANKSFGSKMPRADWSLLSLLPIPAPNLQQQEKLVQALDCFQDEINQITDLKNLLIHQKHGLMQQLLTGKLRTKAAT